MSCIPDLKEITASSTQGANSLAGSCVHSRMLWAPHIASNACTLPSSYLDLLCTVSYLALSSALSPILVAVCLPLPPRVGPKTKMCPGHLCATSANPLLEISMQRVYPQQPVLPALKGLMDSSPRGGGGLQARDNDLPYVTTTLFMPRISASESRGQF